MMQKSLTLGALACAAAAMLAGCGGSSGSNMSGTSAGSSAQSAPVFLMGTDAPLPSVVSFQVTINSVTLSNGGSNGVNILSAPQTVDFGRYNGLQTLLDFNSIPAGTYNTVTVSLSAPSIATLTLGSGGAASITPVPNVTLMNSTPVVQLSQPFTVTAGQAIGLKMDFDLRQSLLTDSTGQITGEVNPTLDFKALTPNTPDAEIDEFYATVTSVNTSQNTFMVQGPHGHQYTVALNQANTGSGATTTEWDDNGDESGNSQGGNNGQINLASLVPNQTIVDLAGEFQPNTQTLDATDVAIISQSGFYAGGTVTTVNPMTGPANTFQMYVRSLLPTSTGLQVGQLATVQLTGNEKFFVFRRHSPLLQFLFNSSLMIPGQHVSIGGPVSGAANASAVSVRRVVLHLSGISGHIVAGSVNTADNSFLLVPDGLDGYLLSKGNPTANPVRVYLTGETRYRGGFSSMDDVANDGSSLVRVVGLVLNDPMTGKPLVVGRYMDKTPNGGE